MTIKVKGIVLNRYDFRESDRLFVIYTDELGKIEAMAKGAKKIQSKMASYLDFFSIVNLMVARGKNYYQIAGAETDKNFLNLKLDFGKIILLSYCFEVVDSLVKPECRDPKIYDLIGDLLKIFNEKQKKDKLKFYGLSKIFILKFLSFLGWTPELFYCVKCKRKIVPNGNFFDVGRGGLVCGACSKNGVLISTAAIKILRFVLEKNLKDFLTLKINKKDLKEVAEIIDSFLMLHQDRELKSGVWIKWFDQLL